MHRHRFAAGHGLVWGATTIDWGDVKPEHVWGVAWDADSNPAIDVYDNALYLTAIDAFVQLPGTTDSDRVAWPRLAEQGSREFRGAAGTLGQAVVLLQAWAREHAGADLP